MEAKERKEAVQEWKNRKPEIGVISVLCTATGDQFIGISSDTKADLNSNQFKLSARLHPNKDLQKLWDDHGEQNFSFVVLRTLEYKDSLEQQTDKLQALLDECLSEEPQARTLRP